MSGKTTLQKTTNINYSDDDMIAIDVVTNSARLSPSDAGREGTTEVYTTTPRVIIIR